MILVDLGLCGASTLAGILGSLNRSKPQRVHHRYRPCSHGENVAQNSADAGSRSLKWFDKRRMIVRLDLERTGPTIADVNDTGILAWPLHDQLATRRQPLQVDA